MGHPNIKRLDELLIPDQDIENAIGALPHTLCGFVHDVDIILSELLMADIVVYKSGMISNRGTESQQVLIENQIAPPLQISIVDIEKEHASSRIFTKYVLIDCECPQLFDE